MQAPTPSTAQKNGKNALEWSVFAVSFLLVVGLIAVLAFEAAVWTERPPELTTRLATPEIKNGQVTVTVEVTNHGDVAAADVRIELTRTTAGIDHHTFVLVDFVPRHGTRRGHASFPLEGEAGSVKVAGIGFAEP